MGWGSGRCCAGFLCPTAVLSAQLCCGSRGFTSTCPMCLPCPPPQGTKHGCQVSRGICLPCSPAAGAEHSHTHRSLRAAPPFPGKPLSPVSHLQCHHLSQSPCVKLSSTSRTRLWHLSQGPPAHAHPPMGSGAPSRVGAAQGSSDLCAHSAGLRRGLNCSPGTVAVLCVTDGAVPTASMLASAATGSFGVGVSLFLPLSKTLCRRQSGSCQVPCEEAGMSLEIRQVFLYDLAWSRPWQL